MDEKIILEKLKDIKSKKDALLAQLNAMCGAEQVLEELLKTEQKGEEKSVAGSKGKK